jgi:SSS family solute:Na+ symporter/sodium/proline symporter
MSQLHVVVLAVIVVVLLSVAVYRTFRVKTKADYLVAGGSLPAFVLVRQLPVPWRRKRAASHLLQEPL